MYEDEYTAEDMRVVILQRGNEYFIWTYDVSRQDEMLRGVGRMASSEELSLTWYDAAWIASQVRKGGVTMEPKTRYDHNANDVTGCPIDWDGDMVPIQEWREQQQEIERLRGGIAALCETLQWLHDLQNGPPLQKYRDEWEEIMNKAEGLLKEWGDV